MFICGLHCMVSYRQTDSKSQQSCIHATHTSIHAIHPQSSTQSYTHVIHPHNLHTYHPSAQSCIHAIHLHPYTIIHTCHPSQSCIHAICLFILFILFMLYCLHVGGAAMWLSGSVDSLSTHPATVILFTRLSCEHNSK